MIAPGLAGRTISIAEARYSYREDERYTRSRTTCLTAIDDRCRRHGSFADDAGVSEPLLSDVLVSTESDAFLGVELDMSTPLHCMC